MSTPNQKQPVDRHSTSLKESDIVTERSFSRRSFVAVAGAFLAGGAMAALTQGRPLAAQTTPPASDPDSKKSSDPDKKKKKHKHHGDPDHKKSSDPDHKSAAKPSDPDSK